MLQTACHAWHVQQDARMVDFAGWEMPIQYSTITEEHHAVRRAAGLFDIAHMGRIEFTGVEAAAFLDSIVTNNVAAIEVGQIRYALVTNEAGGILDDVLVYRLDDSYLLVVNASNRLKILDWIEQHRGGFDVTVEDRTTEKFMFALQGPRAIEILNPLIEDCDIAEIGYYRSAVVNFGGEPGLLSRTGYTGEDGFEIICATTSGAALWNQVIEAGANHGLLPAGLGCRDTLRLEAAMPLYGHELDETTDPYTAGLAFGVKLDAADFIGKPAVAEKKAEANRKRRVGLQLEGRRIAREGAIVFSGEQEIGQVTSGTFSPTLETSIAMAYVSANHAAAGTTVEIDIRGKRHAATVAKLPFYKRG
ncbi:MAG: glycine cleavage system aminomethyltransferase GcvT [Planctomycetaceae bacterium]|jgi:aminomethyltransferase|nr:glycine cleavage system aminomethyltransferase GcvT [Planctomycetaceae bacterium]MBT6156845.1 glycine cleavage system aminomethyltransferase GcvT [Planctomycetaceae bacterium]MBT6484157.1 glycine cleavage system aminomethyltransferase GcvT [Planctomycetaceae bacterium]MBT6495230.1 glycine cleavage system aminomethyltransferase GcvT [Planctomycetaceae bacterium]